ncbi:L-piperidine-6-carboxylate dehydrogenase [Kaarinaea lacus]
MSDIKDLGANQVDILKTLHLNDRNSATYLGKDGWCQTATAGVIDSIDPSNRKRIASVYACNNNDVQKLISNSVEFQKEWRMVPAPQRGEVIRQIGNALRDYKDALGSLVSLEMGKIKAEGDGEVQEMIDVADFAVGQSRMLYGKTMHSERPYHRMYEQWHPLGVVGVISAFNFPVAVWSWNAFIAAIAGNSVVWKPSSKVPLCAVAVQHICNEVTKQLGFPGLFSMFVPAGRSIAETFINDNRIPLVSFTGSSATGRHVYQTMASRMGKVLLECSGNNAIIVDASADLKLAVPAIVFGAVGTAGQRCTTTRRLLVHAEIYDDLVQGLINAYQQVKIGNPLDDSTLMGPLIDQQAVEDFNEAVTRAKEAGATILCGGNALQRSGNFVEPTIIAVDQQHDIVRKETFAPVLYVQRYHSLDEAIAIQNDVPQGLSSAIFTNDVRNAEQFLSAKGSDCGIANVNIGTSGAEIGGAFGGEKETGGGRESGSDSWKAYMRRQTNTINWGTELPLAQGIKFELPGD